MCVKFGRCEEDAGLVGISYEVNWIKYINYEVSGCMEY